MLEAGRSSVCAGRKEAEHGEAESAEDEYQQRQNHSENELAHESSRNSTIVADVEAGALIAMLSTPSIFSPRGLRLQLSAGSDVLAAARRGLRNPGRQCGRWDRRDRRKLLR